MRLLEYVAPCNYSNTQFISDGTKTNILFGLAFDKSRYDKGLSLAEICAETNIHMHPVIKQCALEQDLSLWKAGDMTEVGEKGLTLRCGSFFPTKGNHCLITLPVVAGDKRYTLTQRSPTVKAQSA